MGAGWSGKMLFYLQRSLRSEMGGGGGGDRVCVFVRVCACVCHDIEKGGLRFLYDSNVGWRGISAFADAQ